MINESLQKLLDENSWDDAITMLESMSLPLSDDLLEKLGWCYSRAGKYANAVQVCNDLITKYPTKAKWYYMKGYQYYMLKEWQTAVDNFVKALEFYTDYFVVKYRLAYAYFQLAGTDRQWSKDVFWKAIRQLEECHKIFAAYADDERIKNSSTYADICALHGKHIMSSERHIDKSIELLKTAINLNNNDDDFKYQLAKAYYIKKDYPMALNYLPNLDKPYYIPELKSQIFADNGNLEESNRILLSLTRYRRKDYLFQRLAENYIQLDSLDEAEDFSIKAVQADDRNYKNYLIRGKVLKERRELKSAILFFEKARQKKQKQFQVDCAEAIKLIDEIMEQTNNNPQDIAPKHIDSVTSEKTGIITKYDKDKGFGFIKESATGESYFFHFSQFVKNVVPLLNMKVHFEVEQAEKGPRAINIKT